MRLDLTMRPMHQSTQYVRVFVLQLQQRLAMRTAASLLGVPSCPQYGSILNSFFETTTTTSMPLSGTFLSAIFEVITALCS